MQITLQLKNGKTLIANSDLLTVRMRKEVKRKLKNSQQEIVDDKAILGELETEFKTTAPSQQRIYEAFLSLVKPVEENEDTLFYEELCRVCCLWKKDDGSLVPLTENEFQELPFEVGSYIGDNLFNDEEKSFLVVAPALTSAS